MEIITGEKIWEMEPNLSKNVKAMLYAPTGAIICPFKLTIALAENANVNGVEFAFDTEVKDIQKMTKGYKIDTTKGCYETKCIVNAAGVYADVFHNMVSEEKLLITPRKGEYCLMDKKAGNFVSHTIYSALPTAMGKGVLITPTVHGNLLAGPTAENIEDKEGIDTTGEGIAKLSKMAKLSAENIPLNMVITSFAGLRAAEKGRDFVLGEISDAMGFFDAAGIQSPGAFQCTCNWRIFGR